LIASGPLGTTGPSGPTGPFGPIATNAAFLYQTPWVRFIDPVTPFLTNGDAIDLANLSGPSGPPPPAPRIIEQHLENMLDAVFEWGPQSPVWANTSMSIECSYGFPLNAGGTPSEILAVTPIRFVPTEYMTPSDKRSFVMRLGASLRDWHASAGTGDDVGTMIFDLRVLASGMTGPGEALKPTLEFEQLRVPMDRIDWYGPTGSVGNQ
jgi:hypothetical protein